MDEEWRDAPGYEAFYEVSDIGRVRNKRNGRLVKSRPDKDGYLLVSLYSHTYSDKTDPKVHRLVLWAFAGAPPEGRPEVDHKNRVRDDNRLGNLRWVSRSMNKSNRTPTGATGILGVRFRTDQERPNPYQAYTSVGGRFKSLGHFSTLEAAAARREAFNRQELIHV